MKCFNQQVCTKAPQLEETFHFTRFIITFKFVSTKTGMYAYWRDNTIQAKIFFADEENSFSLMHEYVEKLYGTY